MVTAEVADKALDMLAVDRFGLDEMDRRILLTLIDKFQGGPIGLDTLATAVCEEKPPWKMSTSLFSSNPAS